MLADTRIEEAYQLSVRDRKLDSGSEDLPDVPESVTGRVAG